MKTAAQMVHDFRKSRGITQVHVGTRAGLTGQKVSAYETGLVRMPADEFLRIIVDGFGVTPQIFFEDQLSENECAEEHGP